MYVSECIEDAAITNHPHPLLPPTLTKEQKITAIAHHFRQIMQVLDLDLSHPSLQSTPERFARMYVDELFSGLDIDAFPDVACFDNDFMEQSEGIVLVKDIPIKSMCEHHFVPIIGSAHVAYVPAGTVLGLSKINRIVDYFCRRPQLQERLNAQIADALSILLHTEDVAVSIQAEHFCVTLRGIQHPTSRTYTAVKRGRFKNELMLKDF
jgi:GTP cyclohydrolase IA